MKESDAFVLLPGGFGTLDEAFELLTLVQTGKAQPAPIVLLDVPGGTYWRTWLEFVEDELARAATTSRRDDLSSCASPTTSTSRSTRSSASTANYHSLRFVEGDLVLRMQHAPVDARARRAERASSPTSSCAARSSAIDATQGRDRRRRRHVDLARLCVPLRPPQLRAPARAHRPRSTAARRSTDALAQARAQVRRRAAVSAPIAVRRRGGPGADASRRPRRRRRRPRPRRARRRS